ncbi:hypothetical protein K493DRAFT_57851 [Basidiobolus meristosporus CBS 931.73]|uniref:Uncharacterized protein n=1 Tax=Basidiobolus meristosporus CBS 931.73 TaxID=1314790 RepID=A0A1Y1XYQ5_9FUNG|nr:hypothetical protein K493DRAFT_57851 [Basidiobolus meristosporus CBS 931.73]|eukprot:ORX90616.1 hypothetical protein K493DRAFT_57851 [Basidiobolus meristosporus CBS 931.73]
MMYSNPGLSALAVLALFSVQIQTTSGQDPGQGPPFFGYDQPPPPEYFDPYYRQAQQPWNGWNPYQYDSRGPPPPPPPPTEGRVDYQWRPEVYDTSASRVSLPVTAPAPTPANELPDRAQPPPPPTTKSYSVPPAIDPGPTPGQLFGDLVPGPITGIKVDLNTNELKNSFSSGTFDSIKQRITQQKKLGTIRPPPEVNTENIVKGIDVLSKVSMRLAKQVEDIGTKATNISATLSRTSASQKKHSLKMSDMLKRMKYLESQLRDMPYGRYGVTTPAKPISVQPPISPQPGGIWPTSGTSQPSGRAPWTPTYPPPNQLGGYGVDTNILTLAPHFVTPWRKRSSNYAPEDGYAPWPYHPGARQGYADEGWAGYPAPMTQPWGHGGNYRGTRYSRRGARRSSRWRGGRAWRSKRTGRRRRY